MTANPRDYKQGAFAALGSPTDVTTDFLMSAGENRDVFEPKRTGAVPKLDSFSDPARKGVGGLRSPRAAVEASKAKERRAPPLTSLEPLRR